MEQKNALFEQMPVRKAFFKLALPVVLSMVVSLVYNMVDTYFIAKTGNAHLVAGVALGSPVFTLMIAVGDIYLKIGRASCRAVPLSPACLSKSGTRTASD